MQQYVTKVASDKSNFNRPMHHFRNARTAWEDILLHYTNKYDNLKVLLPSYIGFSEREGSGIFDPISEHQLPYDFYGLDKHLKIDKVDFKTKVSSGKEKKLVLLVHYFGFVDDSYNELCDWLDKNEILYVEDCAHSMLTDLVGGSCGRRGSHSFYSIHKLLPFEEGGILVNNGKQNDFHPQFSKNNVNDIFHFDLKAIFDKRRENYMFLVELLNDMDSVEILKKNLLPGECPQSLPLLLLEANRDALYFEMNKLGFGLVSLYHTMIQTLKETDYESSTYTSKYIINLPVHQDINKDKFIKMTEAFKRAINKA